MTPSAESENGFLLYPLFYHTFPDMATGVRERGLRPDLAPCRDWVRGREQSEANEKWAACERATRR